MNDFFNALKAFFAPPVFKGDEEKTRAAELVNTILITITTISVLGLVALLLGGTAGPAVFGAIFLLVVVMPLLQIPLRRGYVQSVSILTVVILTVILILALGLSGTVRAPAISILILISVIAGLTLGRNAAYWSAAINTLLVAGLVYGEVNQLLPPSDNTVNIQQVFVFALAALLTVILMNQALGRIQSALNQLAELNAGLEQRVVERTQALSSVAEVGAATSTILETDKLLQQVVDLTKEHFGLYHAHIYLLNEAGDTLVLASGAGEPGRQMVAQGRSIRLDREQSLVARAARERKGVIVNDVTQEPDFLPNPLLPDTHAELAVPMIVGEKVIGVFDVQSDIVGRFTEADIAIQTALASQIASAVRNANLYAQAESSAQEARSLVENAPEAIIIVDLATGLFVEPNENAVKLYGLPRDELVRVGPAQMSPPTQPDGRDSTQAALEKIGEAMEGGTPVFDWMHRNAQGQDIPCEVRLVRMPGEHPRVRASVTDVTERKRYEDLLAKRAVELETIARINEKVQSTTTIEAALQIAARELGHTFGKKPTAVTLTSNLIDNNHKGNSSESSR